MTAMRRPDALEGEGMGAEAGGLDFLVAMVLWGSAETRDTFMNKFFRWE